MDNFDPPRRLDDLDREWAEFTERPVPIVTGDDARRLRLFLADVMVGAGVALIVVWAIGRIVELWA